MLQDRPTHPQYYVSKYDFMFNYSSKNFKKSQVSSNTQQNLATCKETVICLLLKYLTSQGYKGLNCGREHPKETIKFLWLFHSGQ